MNLIVDIQYFPSVILYKYLYKCSHIYFEQYDSYQKMSFRNRCMIAGANGSISLSIPLESGRDQRTLMKDVRISDAQDWQKQHWKTLLSTYNRSPWFEFFRDELEALYRRKYVFLIDWNMDCFTWTMGKLGLKLSISKTDKFAAFQEKDDVLDLRNKLLPRNFREFECPVYSQVFQEKTGFIPNLSILDLLFCEGNHAAALLAGRP